MTIAMMRTRPWPARAAAFCAAALAALSAGATAQVADTTIVSRPLATRVALERLAEQLRLHTERSEGTSSILVRVNERLEKGDFGPGDLVLLDVQDEVALSDTFSVGPDTELRLPSPVTGPLSLHGVLMSELEAHVTRELARFIRDPIVRARPLLRLSVQGEVVHAGIHAVPADAVIADALMAAGGTTTHAKMDELRIDRNGETIWEGEALQQAIAAGKTVDEVRLHDGDAIIVERRGEGITQHLQFLWMVVSITGGIYGLSRVF